MLSLIPGWNTLKLILIAVGIFGLIGGTAYITHRVDNSKYEALELQYSQAVAKAQQEELTREQAIDKAKDQAALEATQAQQVIINSTKDQLNALKKYTNSHCITNGIVSVLNSSALGDQSKSVSNASGQSLNTCSTIASARVYEWIVRNNGIARQNAKQLDELIKSVQILNKF